MNGSWADFPSTKWTDGNIIGGSVWRSTWWPATGYRNRGSATMASVAYYGRCWSSSPNSSYASYSLCFNYDGNVNPSGGNNRSHCFSLRCVQE